MRSFLGVHHELVPLLLPSSPFYPSTPANPRSQLPQLPGISPACSPLPSPGAQLGLRSWRWFAPIWGNLKIPRVWLIKESEKVSIRSWGGEVSNGAGEPRAYERSC